MTLQGRQAARPAAAFAMIQPKLLRYSRLRTGEGGSIVSCISACRCEGVVADRRRIVRSRSLSRGLAGRRSGQLRRRGRARGPALADCALEGRPFARRLCRGEAARGRAFADCARRQCRGEVARAARRAAILLVRRGRDAGGRDVAREARARARAGRVQHAHLRHRRPRPRAAAAARGAGNRLARARYLESRDGKPVFRMDREAVRCAARRRAVLARAARGVARSLAQHPVQLSRSRRGPDGDRRPPRLRRPAVLPARVLCIQDGAAVRVLEVLARRRRQAAAVP